MTNPTLSERIVAALPLSRRQAAVIFGVGIHEVDAAVGALIQARLVREHELPDGRRFIVRRHRMGEGQPQAERDYSAPRGTALRDNALVQRRHERPRPELWRKTRAAA